MLNRSKIKDQLSDWFRNLLEDQDRLDEMKETARIYFAGDDVTVNLIPATIILLLLTLGELVMSRIQGTCQ